MLVLGRKTGEVIIVGQGRDMIEIEILSIDKGKVRLGIKANKSVPVHRKEVYEAIQRGKRNEST